MKALPTLRLRACPRNWSKEKPRKRMCAEYMATPQRPPFTDSGNEIWEYDFARMHSKPTNFIPYVSLIHSGAEGDKKSLVIFFDRSKVVRQYTISSSKVDVSQGLITR
jgi:hypothetical protein